MNFEIFRKEITGKTDDGDLTIIVYFKCGFEMGWCHSVISKVLWDDWEAGLCAHLDVWYIEEAQAQWIEQH